jgi:hypothetical protein
MQYGKTSTPQGIPKGIPNADGIDYSQRRAVVVVEGATLATFVTGTIAMLIIGILLNIVGLGIFCWALFALATHALPFFVLCGRPHKTNYVACRDMWRTRRKRFCGARKRPSYATYLYVDDRCPSSRWRIDHARRTIQGANRCRSLSGRALCGISRAISQEGARGRLLASDAGAYRVGVASRCGDSSP